MSVMPQIVFRSRAAYPSPRATFLDLLISSQRPWTSQPCLKSTGSTLTYMLMTQLYDSSTVVDAESVRDRPTVCTSDVARRCASNRLQLNPDKTAIIWFGWRYSLPYFNASTSRSKSEPVTFSQAASSVSDIVAATVGLLSCY